MEIGSGNQMRNLPVVPPNDRTRRAYGFSPCSRSLFNLIPMSRAGTTTCELGSEVESVNFEGPKLQLSAPLRD